MKNSIILCSGGLDSVTTAYYVKKRLKYEGIKILFFNYGQRNLKGEERCAKKCALDLNCEFIKVDLSWLGEISLSLLNSSKKAKKIKRKDLKNTKKESKNWYVPCRNTVFLAYALALADSLYIKFDKVWDIFVGFKCEGKESYPDTTKEFVFMINKLAKIGCSQKLNIFSPLIEKDKEDIILLGKKLGVDFRRTFSCYVGPKKQCGDCLACKLRQEGFYWANIKDPTKYVSQ